MQLIIDRRESKLVEFFQNHDYVVIKTLDLGDIIIKYDNKIILIIERKTITDLACSIKDKRYVEQKYRLISNYNKKNILYIIEGKLNFSNKNFIAGINIYTLVSTLINLSLRDNIHYHKTKNINETIRFIKVLVKKFKNGCDFLIPNNNIQQLYSNNTIKIVKKKI